MADLLTSIFGSFILKSKSAFFLEIYANSTQDMYLLNVDDDLTIREIKKLSEGNVFVDVGANIGLYSFYAAQKVGKNGKVLSIEPSFREYRRLLKNIELNKVNNILPFNCIVSEANDIVKFSIEDRHTGMNKIANNTTGNIREILSFKLDFIIELFSISKIDLIKIDVEGAEMLVINGMKSLLHEQRIKQLIIEITPGFLKQYGHSKEMLYNVLNDFGYLPLISSDEWQYDEIFKLKD